MLESDLKEAKERLKEAEAEKKQASVRVTVLFDAWQENKNDEAAKASYDKAVVSFDLVQKEVADLRAEIKGLKSNQAADSQGKTPSPSFPFPFPSLPALAPDCVCEAVLLLSFVGLGDVFVVVVWLGWWGDRPTTVPPFVFSPPIFVFEI